jgi:ActR/RegA family two-component response regulator
MDMISQNVEPCGHVYPQRSEILVLDDSDFDRKKIRRTLSKLPFSPNVTEIADIAGLGNVARAKAFDIILVDYSLTDGDGLQALKEIKSSDLNQGAMVVMVTGFDSSALAVNAMKMGFDDYLTKKELNLEALSKIMTTRRANFDGRSTSSAIDLPVNPHILNQIVENMLSSPKVERLLEPIFKSALDRAISRCKLSDVSALVSSHIATFEQEDEFIFLQPK